MAGESRDKPDLVLRKELGGKIREIRKACGFTQESLGERSGLSYKFIGELERGQVNVSIDSLNRIAGGLGVEVGDLFERKKRTGVQRGKEPLLKLSPAERKILRKALRLLNKIIS